MTRPVEIPDAAVEAGAKAIADRYEHAPDMYRGDVRAALVAARPYLMPTREEIRNAIYDAAQDSASRPLEFFGRDEAEVLADAVLALLNGAESEPECDCRYGHQPQYTKHEHTCSWGRWHLVQQAWNGAES